MTNIYDNRYTNEKWYTYDEHNVITHTREIFSTAMSHDIDDKSYSYDEYGRNYILETKNKSYNRCDDKIDTIECSAIFKYLYEDNTEKPTSCVDKNNEVIVTYKYNERGDIIEKHKVKLNYTHKYIYDDSNRLIEEHVPNKFGMPCHIYFNYDDNGNKIYERIHEKEDLTDKTDVSEFYYFYNENNKKIREEITHVFSNGDHKKDIIHYEYNDKNQLIHEYRDLMKSDYRHMYEVFYDYDDRGNLIHEFKYTNDI